MKFDLTLIICIMVILIVSLVPVAVILHRKNEKLWREIRGEQNVKGDKG